MTRHVAVIAALSLFQLEAAHDWRDLQALAKGSSLEVRREDKETFHGTLTSISENQIVVATKSGPQTFGRSTVRTVKVKSNAGRTRNALIGAAIAGGSVALGMSIICASCFGERNNWGSTVAAVSAAAAGGGAAVGWLIPGYKTVYKAPKAPGRKK
ncbi:MAG: hypothetical protein ABI972_08680 [Acidobacteriota bacterium]